jgi:hypothetical protein
MQKKGNPKHRGKRNKPEKVISSHNGIVDQQPEVIVKPRPSRKQILAVQAKYFKPQQ